MNSHARQTAIKNLLSTMKREGGINDARAFLEFAENFAGNLDRAFIKVDKRTRIGREIQKEQNAFWGSVQTAYNAMIQLEDLKGYVK